MMYFNIIRFSYIDMEFMKYFTFYNQTNYIKLQR